jgi:plastocyanin
MNRYLLIPITLLVMLLSACAPASTSTPAPAAAPTVDAMMKDPTPTTEAMMAQGTGTPNAMMESGTGTPEAMMGPATGTPDAMMPKETPGSDAMMPKETPGSGAMMGPLPDPITTPHFVDSAPMHGAKFALVPDQVLINFDFTLHEDSEITVTRDGAPLTIGKTTLGDKKLSLSATLPKDAGDGLYVVKYKACWPDRSCHNGQFGFTVDSKAKSSYLDLTGKSEVTLHLKGVQFTPPSIIISKGTKVTWVNDDPVIHFVNSDPHPSHNAVPALNSLEIKQGESYSYTFDQAGEWAYHCSAHVPQNMFGRIIVVEGDAMAKSMPDQS